MQLGVFWQRRCIGGLATEASADQSLRLSTGEYSHVVDIGALDLESALALVDERGRCYDEAPEGVMVTVLAVDHDTVAAVEQAPGQGAVTILASTTRPRSTCWPARATPCRGQPPPSKTNTAP